ncbi:hypothetical protein U9M48_000998 [Paspalum notatum var. saurae]|uniref:Dirigent protein n=1 Tax=Paspalum notatum var. saurae TaxID=547442 RepID=A0AAQ3PHN4_PASNO
MYRPVLHAAWPADDDASSTAADYDDDGLTHIQLYVHETFPGPNATAMTVLQSPLGAATSTFGSMGVVDDEIRSGPDRSSSALLGRYQAVFFGMSLEQGKGFLSAVSLVFTAGEYAGSTLSVEGPILGFTGTIERAVVGGTGRFRLAQGYMLWTMISNPTANTSVNEVHLFSPLGATNSSFGAIGVVDDEIRAGPNRSSPLLGRYQGVFFGTSLELGKGYLSSISLVFTAGEYAGSTLSVEGPILGFTGTIERAVVGGTGKFRLARGYMLFKMISKPTPETDVNESI